MTFVQRTLVVVALNFFFSVQQTTYAQPPRPVQFDISTEQAMEMLEEPKFSVEAFLRLRANLDSNVYTYYRASGTITAFIPGERDKPLFGFEMYNVSRVIATDTGYIMLSKEVGLYTDLKTGEPLDMWYNPFTKDSVEVMHVFNDPVNQVFPTVGIKKPYFRFKPSGNGRMTLATDIFLCYPSPVPGTEFPELSRSDLYEGAELFSFFFDGKGILNPDTSSVFSEVSWTRISDFLPWMKMGDRPGHLVYSCRGYKTENRAEIPPPVSAYVNRFDRTFLYPPMAYSSPNATSWSNIRKRLTELK